MHGRGYGNDGPLLTPQDRGSPELRELRLQRGNAFVWKPIAYSADEQIEFSTGGSIVVTDMGGEQLVAREPRLISSSPSVEREAR
ncbi:MAG TPA: hypothetical protein VK457_20855 [Chloroflexota bacterium]|nr:hypothetical protein [Chloroflexota bacterium]